LLNKNPAQIESFQTTELRIQKFTAVASGDGTSTPRRQGQGRIQKYFCAFCLADMWHWVHSFVTYMYICVCTLLLKRFSVVSRATGLGEILPFGQICTENTIFCRKMVKSDNLIRITAVCAQKDHQ
jgi:hypothetical protein